MNNPHIRDSVYGKDEEIYYKQKQNNTHSTLYGKMAKTTWQI